jgi:thiamine biosynthesis lipoprotein
VPADTLLFQALQFALAVAAASGGAFDPTVGLTMEALGFNRHDRTGRVVRRPAGHAGPASFRDVDLDAVARTVTVHRPLVLDLGAVAKGLAIDLAARELRAFDGFAIDAGGDLFLGGRNPDGEPWAVGVRDPAHPDVLLEIVRVSDRAVCTSGDYERRTMDDAGHHIVDPRTAQPADAVASATVIAHTAIVADAMATAAFVLGPVEGLRFLEDHGVEGLLVSSGGVRGATAGFPGERTCVS